MGARVFKELCRACRGCLSVCPGDLLVMGEDKTVRILEPDRCWGCGACLKACPHRAIGLALHPGLGGRGLVLTVVGENLEGQTDFGQREKALPIRLRWWLQGPGFFEQIVTEPGRPDGY
ncbi:MAG: 4Fe-4S binding protein [Deltaproteobacteria bacterium]|jgi:NAD-dependent dihydropyrimidine dehydrogenase PreA subunit|nr:4Fe-4S binding protein [Deltaproteobacteria bacterium]